jgi:hypothetical protein
MLPFLADSLAENYRKPALFVSGFGSNEPPKLPDTVLQY